MLILLTITITISGIELNKVNNVKITSETSTVFLAEILMDRRINLALNRGEIEPSPTPTPMPRIIIPTPIPTPTPAPATPTPIPQEKVVVSSNDLDELARIIFFEARGLSWDGKLAVGQVIINRSELYGMSIPATIHQKASSGIAFFAPTSFSDYYYLTVDDSCREAAVWLLEGNRYSPVGDAIYFCTVKSYENFNWHYEYVNFGSGRITLNSEGHVYIR